MFHTIKKMGKQSSRSSRSSPSSRSSRSSKAKWREPCSRTIPIGDSQWDVAPGGSYQMYQTHDNGGRAFRVFIDRKDRVAVVTLMVSSEWPEDCYPFIVNQRFPFHRVWIGKSPRIEMTEKAFHGGYGPTFDGNSILFDLSDNTYMFVGDSVQLFQTKSPIVRYVSPVGQNDVPYPYAVDKDGAYYLIVESVKVKSREIAKGSNPYDWYYNSPKPLSRSKSIRPIEIQTLVPRNRFR